MVEAGEDGCGVIVEESPSPSPSCIGVSSAEASEDTADIFDIALPILWDPEASKNSVVCKKSVDSSCCVRFVGSTPESVALLLLKYEE